MPAQTHKKKATPSKRRFFQLTRLFSRHKRSTNRSEGSMSIDFDQFSISDGPASSAGKRFSESHINPGVNFDTEGRLPHAEEVSIDGGYAIYNMEDDDLDTADLPRSVDFTGELPITSIDDVSLDSRDEIPQLNGDLFQSARNTANGGDFVAI